MGSSPDPRRLRLRGVKNPKDNLKISHANQYEFEDLQLGKPGLVWASTVLGWSEIKTK